MSKSTRDLQAVCDRLLIEQLPAGMKSVIDDLLARGLTHAGVLARLRESVERQRQTPEQGKLTLAQVEAYLLSLLPQQATETPAPEPTPRELLHECSHYDLAEALQEMFALARSLGKPGNYNGVVLVRQRALALWKKLTGLERWPA